MPLIRQGPGLIGTAARAGVAAGVAGRVRRRQEQRWAAQDQPAYEQQTAGTPAPQAAPTAPDYTVELEKLAKLRDEGVITPEDYEAKKQQLLGL
jgi:hypothetical protein